MQIERRQEFAKENNLVDIAAGTGPIETWTQEIQRVYHRKDIPPETIVLILEEKNGEYKGALYISRKDFRR